MLKFKTNEEKSARVSYTLNEIAVQNEIVLN